MKDTLVKQKSEEKKKLKGEGENKKKIIKNKLNIKINKHLKD